MKKIEKTILITEDEVATLRALTDRFAQAGFTVLSAKNGEEGIALALEKHPDLILLDLMMPVMDGITLLKRLRVDEWGKAVPVIILTNLNDAKKVSESVEEGVFDYLIKVDWTLDEIVNKVKAKLMV